MLKNGSIDGKFQTAQKQLLSGRHGGSRNFNIVNTVFEHSSIM